MNEQDFPKKLEFRDGSMKFALEWLRPYIQACPQMIQQGIGAAVFVDDLHKACEKFAEYFMKQD
jgi:hypothetical protein